MHKSYHTYEWVMAHIWMSHVTHMNETCHTYECVVPHIWMRHVTRMNETCHTYERHIHIWMSHATRMNESYHTYATHKWGTSHVWQIWRSHGTHIYRSHGTHTFTYLAGVNTCACHDSFICVICAMCLQMCVPWLPHMCYDTGEKTESLVICVIHVMCLYICACHDSFICVMTPAKIESVVRAAGKKLLSATHMRL